MEVNGIQNTYEALKNSNSAKARDVMSYDSIDFIGTSTIEKLPKEKLVRKNSLCINSYS